MAHRLRGAALPDRIERSLHNNSESRAVRLRTEQLRFGHHQRRQRGRGRFRDRSAVGVRKLRRRGPALDGTRGLVYQPHLAHIVREIRGSLAVPVALLVIGLSTSTTSTGAGISRQTRLSYSGDEYAAMSGSSQVVSLITTPPGVRNRHPVWARHQIAKATKSRAGTPWWPVDGSGVTSSSPCRIS